MDLHPGEPDLAPWRSVDDDGLLALVGRPALVLVDGGSGSGKTSLALRIASLLGGGVVHTDDVAWNHSRFDWADVLVDGVLEPWRRGEEVVFRPPGWVTHDRAGHVGARAGAPLVVEGVGAARDGLADRADLVVWVQADRTLARTRGIARDASYGTRTLDEAAEFWDDWMTEEVPFLAADRPWERADLVVLGTPRGGRSESLTAVSESRQN